MKILTEEAAAGIIPIKTSRSTWLLMALAQLKMGQAIVIDNADWKSKLPPYRTIRNAERILNMTFDYGKMPDGSGWIAKRIK